MKGYIDAEEGEDHAGDQRCAHAQYGKQDIKYVLFANDLTS
jgi:hypothetical protein